MTEDFKETVNTRVERELERDPKVTRSVIAL